MSNEDLGLVLQALNKTLASETNRLLEIEERQAKVNHEHEECIRTISALQRAIQRGSEALKRIGVAPEGDSPSETATEPPKREIVREVNRAGGHHYILYRDDIQAIVKAFRPDQVDAKPFKTGDVQRVINTEGMTQSQSYKLAGKYVKYGLDRGWIKRKDGKRRVYLIRLVKTEHDPDFKPLCHDIPAMREGKILY